MNIMVVNKFEKVAVTIGRNCVRSVYDSLSEAIDAVSKGYSRTVWSEVNDDVCFYGWVTEPNGYPHTQGDPIFKCKESAFWDGKKPSVNEKRKAGL